MARSTADEVNLADNYFAVGHPSLTNYLEIVGGSNFGVRSDNSRTGTITTARPICTPAFRMPTTAAAMLRTPIDTSNICPIAGVGTDAVTEAVDNWNEVTSAGVQLPGEHRRHPDGPGRPQHRRQIHRRPAGACRHELEVVPGKPAGIAARTCVNNSNGTATDATTYDANKPLSPTNLPPLDAQRAVSLASPTRSNTIRSPTSRACRKARIAETACATRWDLTAARGLYADLASGDVPTLSFIAPNQCDDQHGRGNGDAFCQFDQGTTRLRGPDGWHPGGPESRSVRTGRCDGARIVTSHQVLTGLA